MCVWADVVELVCLHVFSEAGWKSVLEKWLTIIVLANINWDVDEAHFSVGAAKNKW